MTSDSATIQIALAQMAVESSHEQNLIKALDMVKEASESGANIVCLPELFLSPYFPREQNARARRVKVPGRETQALSTAARDHHIAIIGGSVYEEDGNKCYNTCPVFNAAGKFLGSYRKVHLPEDPSFYEQDYFEPGDRFQVFDTGCGIAAPLICFDQWYPEAARVVKLLGAQMIFYPTAIGTVDGIKQSEGSWQKAWESVQTGHAVANSVVVAAVNRVGVEKEMKFWGGSFISDQFGEIIAHAGEDEGVFMGECRLSLGTEIEAGWGFLRNRKPRSYGKITEL